MFYGSANVTLRVNLSTKLDIKVRCSAMLDKNIFDF